MIKILPLDFLVASPRIPWKNKNAVCSLQKAALVPEIFVFEKYVKYTNEMTDEVMYLTQYYITGLDISARPLAQASGKTVWRVPITDHSPSLASTIFISRILLKISVTIYI